MELILKLTCGVSRILILMLLTEEVQKQTLNCGASISLNISIRQSSISDLYDQNH